MPHLGTPVSSAIYVVLPYALCVGSIIRFTGPTSERNRGKRCVRRTRANELDYAGRQGFDIIPMGIYSFGTTNLFFSQLCVYLCVCFFSFCHISSLARRTLCIFFFACYIVEFPSIPLVSQIKHELLFLSLSLSRTHVTSRIHTIHPPIQPLFVIPYHQTIEKYNGQK